MSYLFTSESVSEGHPDKICDQISDALLDGFLANDKKSHVACETLVTTGLVVCSGEVTTNGYVSVDDVARNVIKRIGYDKSDYQFDYKSCGVITTIHKQSQDIDMGVSRKDEKEQGAGDQGIMFGYACNETGLYMPATIEIAHMLVEELAKIRKEGLEMLYLRPDAKSQVTIRYSDDGIPECIDTIVISTQHDEMSESGMNDEFILNHIREDIKNILIPRVVKQLPLKLRGLFDCDYRLLVNPTGKFVIGGPHGDTGLTGRKIIVDTYGGHGAHGGGAFSGKDPSKVDRSAAYAARYIAKNMVAAGLCDKVLVQLAYAIGVAKPVGFYVNTYGTSKVDMSDGELARMIKPMFPLTPYDIINKFGLLNPIYEPTAAYGHFGRTPYIDNVEVFYEDEHTKKDADGKIYKPVVFFGWEQTDMVDELKKVFGLN